MINVPRGLLQRYLGGATMRPEDEDELRETAISDANLSEAMAEPAPADPIAGLRERYLAAQRQGVDAQRLADLSSGLSTTASTLGRNLGLVATPTVQPRDVRDVPVRALERQLAQESLAGRADDAAAAREATLAAREREWAQGAERLALQREEAARKGSQGERALSLREEEFKGRSELERRKLEQEAEEFTKTLGLKYSELSQERKLALMTLLDRQAARASDAETKAGKEAEKDSDYEQSVAVPDLERVPNAPKIKPEQAQKVRDADGLHASMLATIDDLIALKKEYGREALPTIVAEDMKSLRGSLLTMMKGAENLGSLDMGVERVASTQLPDEGTLGPYAIARLERWRKTVVRQHEDFLRKNGYRRPGAAPTTQKPTAPVAAPAPTTGTVASPAPGARREIRKYSPSKDTTYVLDAETGDTIREIKGRAPNG